MELYRFFSIGSFLQHVSDKYCLGFSLERSLPQSPPGGSRCLAPVPPSAFLTECFVAFGAFPRPFVCMDSQVEFEIVGMCGYIATIGAFQNFVTRPWKGRGDSHGCHGDVVL